MDQQPPPPAGFGRKLQGALARPAGAPPGAPWQPAHDAAVEEPRSTPAPPAAPSVPATPYRQVARSIPPQPTAPAARYRPERKPNKKSRDWSTLITIVTLAVIAWGAISIAGTDDSATTTTSTISSRSTVPRTSTTTAPLPDPVSAELVALRDGARLTTAAVVGRFVDAGEVEIGEQGSADVCGVQYIVTGNGRGNDSVCSYSAVYMIGFDGTFDFEVSWFDSVASAQGWVAEASADGTGQADLTAIARQFQADQLLNVRSRRTVRELGSAQYSVGDVRIAVQFVDRSDGGAPVSSNWQAERPVLNDILFDETVLVDQLETFDVLTEDFRYIMILKTNTQYFAS